jgi:polyhydroxyalkanoate synthesis regulator phasin
LGMAKPTIKSYVEAGAQFTEMSRQQAEAVVKHLVKSGDIRRREAEQMLQAMLSRGRDTTDRISALVQTEVAKQLKAMSARFDEVEARLESLASSVTGGIVAVAGDVAGRAGPPPVQSSGTPTTAAEPLKPTTKKVSAKKSTSKKSTSKKSTSKKSTSKKASAKKASAKRSTSKKAAGKRSSPSAVGTSGVRKVNTRAAASE